LFYTDIIIQKNGFCQEIFGKKWVYSINLHFALSKNEKRSQKTKNKNLPAIDYPPPHRTNNKRLCDIQIGIYRGDADASGGELFAKGSAKIFK